ncbi:hypothetical protein G6F68_018381 [Rhizopus microsporus]|nr:hypothetical protein G6F68_018381 [Rhizopus microsporus]
MDFKTNKKVDFKTFTPPVKLHRKEPDRIPYRQYIQQLQQQQQQQQQNGGKPPAQLKNAATGLTEVQPPPTHGPKTGADTSLIAPMGGATRRHKGVERTRTKTLDIGRY